VAGADALAWTGAVAGCVAPLTIGTFVVVGARHKRSYEPWRDTLTQLGDGTDRVAWVFVVVNAVVAVLLGVVAWAVADRLDKLVLTAPFVIAAVESLVLGLTGCHERCKYPCIEGRAPTWLVVLHGVTAGVVGLAIVLAPLGTFVLRNQVPGYSSAGWISLGLFVAALIFGGVLVQQTNARKRAQPRPATKRRPRREERATGAVPGLYERLLWVTGYGWVVLVAVSLVGPGWRAALALLFWLVLALFYVLRPGWRDPSPHFDLADCQPGTLLPVADARYGRFLVGTIDNPRQFLVDLQAALDSGLVGGVQQGAAVTMAMTAAGLARLSVSYRWRARVVEDVFAKGMRARAEALGDTDASDPETWGDGWEHPHLDVAFWIQAATEEEVTGAAGRLRLGFASVSRQVDQAVQRLDRAGDPSSYEHFRFADGISQPWVEDVGDPPEVGRRGGGKRSQRGRWRPLKLGEFVVGQVDETNDIFPVPEPAGVFLGGTFLVVRKLRQNVDAFDAFTAAHPVGKPALEDRIVGRSRDGRPLEDPAEGPRGNEFRYANDPEGLCPLTAHIRRANPRDGLGFGTTLSVRRRIIRRGMPYGGWDDADRGLLFVACNVRIAEQFEFIQRFWLNNGSTFGLGDAPDTVAGNWSGTPRPLVIQGRPPVVIEHVPTVATTRGGDYFFVPSRPGLQALARSPAGPLEVTK